MQTAGTEPITRPSRPARGGRLHHRFGDRGAVDHLARRNQIRRAAGGRGRKRLQTRARDVEPRRFPHLGRALDRLKLAGAEEARAALLGRGARHVRHPFEPHRALRAKHLEAEAGPGRRDRARDTPTRRSSSETASTSCRRSRPAPRGGSSDSRPARSPRPDRSSRRWHGRPSASARRTAFLPYPRARRRVSETAHSGRSSSLRSAGSSRARPDWICWRSVVISGWKRRL